MNKKVLTLCAGLLLAGGANAWGQIDVSAGSYPSRINTSFKIPQVTTSTFNYFFEDESSMTSKSAFPNVSPFAIKKANGAEPIRALENAGTQKAEDKYFQFVVSESTGTHVLTMVFVDGKYQLQVENVANANFPDNPIKLDRTLWKVTAHKDAAGTTLYYELQNKATDAILQLATDPKEVDPSNADFYEADIKIVAGQTDWRWAKGEAASVTSTVDPTAGKVLVDELSAQFSNGKTLYLAKKVKGSKISLGAVVGNSNTAFSSTSISGATFTPIKFEAWEANPILLTAEQINAELGNDLYDDGKSDGKFHFTFAPDVVGDENVMTASDFVAVKAGEATTRKPGDAADGFVRFQKKNSSEFLMVDTTYYNEAAQDRYELKMAVREITLPRYAVVEDRSDVSTIQGLVNSGEAYVGTYQNAPLYSVAAYTQMKRQSNFLPVFYPATSSLKLQAEMIYKKAKTTAPWWKQVKEAITTGNMTLSVYAKHNGVNPLSTTGTTVNAVGYYPAYNAITNGSTPNVMQKLAYEAIYEIPTVANGQKNGYVLVGSAATANNKWYAIPTLNVNTGGYASISTDLHDGEMQLIDPTSADQTTLYDASNKTQLVFSTNFLKSNSNVVKLVTLTADHKVLTTDIADPNDAEFNGLLTNISIDGLRQNGNLSEVVDIKEGFYYIQNANKNASQLNKYGDYRYEDLAATNAMFTYWNNVTEAWDRGVSTTDGTEPTASTYNATKDNAGINDAQHKADKANIGNLVYSSEKLTIPSAQWYIKGNGDHYVMINRESGRQWGTQYWWKTSEEGVYVNQATYTDAAGQLQTYRDTIRLTPVPAAELTDQYLGYLNLTPKEAIADTCVYNIGMNNLGEVRFSLSADENGILKMVQDAQGDYKLERVLTEDVDPYVSGDAAKKYTDDLIYGFAPMAGGEIDSSKMLHRAKYYIYKDEVSANSGIEESSVKTRHYITLSEGQYRLTPVEVKFKKVGDDLYSFNNETSEVPGADESVKVRREFFVKQMTADANNFVLVDPEVVTTTNNGTSTKTAYGARVFVNQLSAGLQPGSLISDGYANSFANSVLNFAKVAKQNYADIRRAGMDRDTVQFYVAGNASYMLGENSNVKGANVGLLDLRAVSDKINNAIFVDTANVHNSACPRFLLGLRDVDTYEVSNIDSHNKHLYTDAAYLVNLIDSAKTNNAYKYTNAGVNAIEYYRLGFLNGRHEGSVLTLDESKKKFYLSDDALGETGLNYATFAFRYVDTDRENFYIETMYDNANKGWLKIHNGVAVVTPDIQEAEVFSFDAVQKEATANEEIAASSVVVAGTNGAVVVKGAEGKNVIVSTILGKVVANEVVSSDNATIAAPAGVVVVSVDGESFKVVVK